MKRFLRLSPIVFILLVAACGTVATPVWSEQAQGTQAALAVTSDYETSIAPTATNTALPTDTPTVAPTNTLVPATATVTPTSEPPTATTVPPTEAPTEEVAAAGASVAGDAAHGEEIFNTFYAETSFACSTCHHTDTEERLIGPGLLNISEIAGTLVPGESAEEYIRQSIVDPSAYVVEGYPDGLMPQNWGTVLSEQDIQDLIAYLFTLKG